MPIQKRQARAITLTLPNAKQPFLILDGKEYALRNFSQEGIGLWVSKTNPFSSMKKGNHREATIAVDGRNFGVKLELVHGTDKVAGLKIVHSSPELTDIFSKLLLPSRIAATLTPHRWSGTEDKKIGFPRLWWVSDEGAELLVWYQPPQGTILGLQLCWGGKWVYRGQYKETRNGFLVGEGRHHPGELLTNDEIWQEMAAPDTSLIKEASQFLTSAPPSVPGYRLWQFLELGELVNLPPEALPALKVA